MTTHSFIFQVSNFDPNSAVGIGAGGIASNQQVLQQEFFLHSFTPQPAPQEISIFAHRKNFQDFLWEFSELQLAGSV